MGIDILCVPGEGFNSKMVRLKVMRNGKNTIIYYLVGAALLMMAFRKKGKQMITAFNGAMTRRGCDAGGCGHYGASRSNGTRAHMGIDILCVPGEAVFSPIDGTVQRRVDPYGDGKYSGLQIADGKGLTFKIMYFEPLSEVIGTEVKAGTFIGYCQDVSQKYASVPPHLHVETYQNGESVDPEPIIF